MKRICKTFMRDPKKLDNYGYVFLLLANIATIVAPLVSIGLFLITGLIFLIEAVLYLKLSLIDLSGFVAALICVFIAAFFAYTIL